MAEAFSARDAIAGALSDMDRSIEQLQGTRDFLAQLLESLVAERDASSNTPPDHAPNDTPDFDAIRAGYLDGKWPESTG